MSRGPIFRIAVLAGLFVLCGAVQEDDKEARREALRTEIEKRFGKGEWREAAKAIRKLRLMVKGEEKEELDGALLRCNGEREWEKFKKLRRSSKRPGKVLKSLDKFIKKFGEDETLLERAEMVREKIRKDVVFVIEGFEDGLDNVYGTSGEIVEGPGEVKEGKAAFRWKTMSLGEEEVRIGSEERSDWTPYRYLTMWIYSAKPGTRLTIDAITTGEDYFEAWSTIDWSGWKKIRLPLQGRGARFRKVGRASWSDIIGVRIWKDEGKPIDIILDEVCLEKEL
ncbi:MAG: hypothetical protein O7H41_19115 [Planctomycetota bacterium]|nr:hypothetical protein [Planctomycetota bacterium]